MNLAQPENKSNSKVCFKPIEYLTSFNHIASKEIYKTDLLHNLYKQICKITFIYHIKSLKGKICGMIINLYALHQINIPFQVSRTYACICVQACKHAHTEKMNRALKVINLFIVIQLLWLYHTKTCTNIRYFRQCIIILAKNVSVILHIFCNWPCVHSASPPSVLTSILSNISLPF